MTFRPADRVHVDESKAHESLERADRRLIADAIRRAGSSDSQYRHVAPHEHPLLWVSDAVAWCYSNGDDWMRRVDTIVDSRVIRL